MDKAQDIIQRIADYAGRPFAVWELCADCHASRTYVRRVLHILARLGYTRRLRYGTLWRRWAVSKKWPPAPTSIIDHFETMYHFTLQDERLAREKRRRAEARKAIAGGC